MRPYSARAFRDRLQRELSDVNGRLYQAEERLWEISLNPESADMLLPPSILHAAMREAQKHHRAEPPLPRTLSPRHQRQQQIGHLQLANVKPPHEPRPPAARRSLALASRADVLATEAALDRRVAAEGETVAAFDAAFEALVEQVRAQCVERGELLGRVRSWLLRHVWWQEHELRRVQQEAHIEAERRQALADKPEGRGATPRGGPREGAGRSCCQEQLLSPSTYSSSTAATAAPPKLQQRGTGHRSSAESVSRGGGGAGPGGIANRPFRNLFLRKEKSMVSSEQHTRTRTPITATPEIVS